MMKMNYLSDIVKNSEELKVNPMDYLNKVEIEVTKSIQKENYQGSLLQPPQRFYLNTVEKVKENYKNDNKKNTLSNM